MSNTALGSGLRVHSQQNLTATVRITLPLLISRRNTTCVRFMNILQWDPHPPLSSAASSPALTTTETAVMQQMSSARIKLCKKQRANWRARDSPLTSTKKKKLYMRVPSPVKRRRGLPETRSPSLLLLLLLPPPRSLGVLTWTALSCHNEITATEPPGRAPASPRQ